MYFCSCDTQREKWQKWRSKQTAAHERNKTHHAEYWTLSILGEDRFLFVHSCTHKNTHRQTSSGIRCAIRLSNVPVNQNVHAWLSCKPLIHHESQFLIPYLLHIYWSSLTRHAPYLTLVMCYWLHDRLRDVKQEFGIQLDIYCTPGYWQNDDDKTDMCRQQKGNVFKAFMCSASVVKVGRWWWPLPRQHLYVKFQ